MRRTWALGAGVVALLLTLVRPTDAFAFHAGITFSTPPAAGGGGGVFYLGTKNERGWDCTMCHLDAPGRLKLRLTSDPPELLSLYQYEPETRYDIKVEMVVQGEELGTQNPMANYNTMGVTFLNAAGATSGKPSGLADVFQEINFSMLFSVGTNAGETTWDFAWNAPDAGVGLTTMHLAVVDGDAAGVSQNTLNDPFGDDVVVTRVELTEITAGAGMSAKPQSIERAESPRSLTLVAAGALLALLCVWGVRVSSRVFS